MVLGLAYEELSELAALTAPAGERRDDPHPTSARALLDELLGLAIAYRRSHDIHALRRLLTRARAETNEELAIRVAVGRGTLTELPVLSIELVAPRWSLRSLALLEATTDSRVTRSADWPQLDRELRRALTRRAATIVVASAPSGGPRAP